jgi:hypothetical protein
MKRDNFLEAAGFNYIANHRTKEIHRVSRLHTNCKIYVLRNAGYCTWVWVQVLMRVFGYDGCRWCYGERNSG